MSLLYGACLQQLTVARALLLAGCVASCHGIAKRTFKILLIPVVKRSPEGQSLISFLVDAIGYGFIIE